nr:MAG: maturation protein [Leviviridae sp.]
MRYRFKDSRSSVQGSNTSLKVNVASTVSYYAGCKNGNLQAMYDVNNPRYADKRNRGLIIQSPMATVKRDCTSVIRSSQWEWSPRGATGSTYGFIASDVYALRFPGHLDWDPSHSLSGGGHGELFLSLAYWNEDEVRQAWTAAMAKVNNPSILALVSMKEWNETSTLLMEMCNLLRARSTRFRAYQAKVSKRGASEKDVRDETANLWLTGRYGVQPLVSDIIGLLEAYRVGAGDKIRETQRASFVAPASGSANVTIMGSSSMIAYVALNRQYTQSDRVYRAGVMNKYTTSIANSLGLGIGNLPSTIWEATRLSFVADWFVNTGEYLSALTASTRADILSSYVTGTQTHTQVSTYAESGSVVNGGQSSICVTNGTGASVSITTTRKTRWAPFSATPIWGPKVELSGKRIADSLALLSKKFR